MVKSTLGQALPFSDSTNILFFTSSGFYLDNKEAAAESYSSCTVCPAGKSCPNEGMSAGDMCPEVSYLFLRK